jgi:membrane peptidoglycan carboxypeptidase
MLLAVVQEGTATKADLQNFDVAGKSGTARRTSGNEGYTKGNYTASFVGLFPGNDPQYVVLVKLDSPKGNHYGGGDIAAPVTRIVLRAALAARDAALDRDDLALSERDSNASHTAAHGKGWSMAGGAETTRAKDPADHVDPASFDPANNLTATAATEGTHSYVVDLPAQPKTAAISVTPRAVPDVAGLQLRDAVRALHSAGFKVRIVRAPQSGTLPAAGTVAPPGTLVQLNRPLE